MKNKYFTYWKTCVSTLFLLVGIVFCAGGQSVSSSEDHTDKVEQATIDISNRLYADVKQQTGMTELEEKEFKKYYEDSLEIYRSRLFWGLMQNTINGLNQQQYIKETEAHFVSLFKRYKQVKAEFPQAIVEAMNPPRFTAGPCNPACDNTDFESGTLSGWTACYASCSGESGSPTSFTSTTPVCSGPLGAVTQAAQDPIVTMGTNNTFQVSITSGTGVDPVAGAAIPVVAPGFGNYSVMIGDGTNPGCGIAILEQTFQVTPANSDFFYTYAAVLQNPSDHSYYQQPYVNVAMLDQNGDTIPFCGNYYAVSGSQTGNGSAWVQTNYGGSATYYLPWTQSFVSLKKYLGQCVTVVIKTADCGKGGHFGYAYFDSKCQQMGIITSSPAVCNNPITLTAPPGGVSYQWTGPCIVGSSTAQTITIGCAGKYTVIIQSVVGAACADTLDTIVPGGNGVSPAPYFRADTVCQGSPTQFNNLTTPTPLTGDTFSWNFGDPGSGANDSSNAVNPVHTYPSAGTYTVTLAVTNGGCGGDTTLTVVVSPVSTAGFTSAPVCLNNPTVFTDTSINATIWHWNFGEPTSGSNNTSTQQNPTHTYGACGTYKVTLVVGVPPCTDTARSTVTVNPLPKALFTAPAECFGQTTTFTDGSTIDCGGTISGWSWNFGDPGSGANNTSTLQNPTHVYSGPGTYNVILTVTSNLGCQSTVTIPVTVNPIPVASFTAPPVCQGHSTIFTSTSTVSSGKITSWNWSFGDGGSSTVQNPVHKYAACGTYNVKLTVTTNGSCTDDTTIAVTVNPMPKPAFTGINVCQGYTTTFTDGSTIGCAATIISWNWNFGDGKGTSTSQNPTYTYSASGTYTVTLTVTSSTGCDSSISKPVTVYPIPVPAFGANTPCQGNATMFTDSSSISSGTIASWKWNFGDGTVTSAVQNPAHLYSAAGTYTVDLIVTSNNGCVDSIEKTVTVNPNPVPDFVADDTVGCVPLCVNFTDLSTISSGSITGWSWDFGDGGTSTAQNPSHCYTQVGTFTVKLTVTSNSGCTETFIRNNYITTYPIPVAQFTDHPQPTTIMDPTIYFTNQSSGQGMPFTYFWPSFGDGSDSTSTLTNPQHTYGDTGTFTVTLIVTNKYGCVDSVKHEIVIEPIWTFYVPNAFTPNGDGLNDGFIGKGVGILTYEMWIFDRWGMLLYHCKSMQQPWDGRVHTGSSSGVECQEDTYVWLIEITDVFHNPHRYIGRVTLIR